MDTHSDTHNFVTYRRSAYTHTHKLNTKLVTYHLSYTLPHTHKLNIHSYAHNFVTYHLFTHTNLTHNFGHTLRHTHNFHIPSLHTHKLNTQLWTHTTLSHTIFHIQYFNLLSHNLSTHNFVTYHVTYHLSHTNLSHTISHIQFACQAWHSWHWVPLAWQAWHLVTFHVAGVAQTRHPPSFHVAGVAQTRIHLRFAWQAWHNLTSTIVLCGRRGTHGTGWRAWVWFRRALVARDAAALCVAGVALGDIHFRFTWQAWHNLTSTSVLRGRRGTHHRFVWQAWHSWHWVARLGLV